MSKVLISLCATAAIGLAACGGSGGNDTSQSSATHDMSAQEMRCMSKQYAAAHTTACAGSGHHAPELAKPLAVASDGLIDAAKVNLAGIRGVNKTHQQEAEQLLVSTIKTLPRWSDVAQATADGFQSIGDGLTGEEHFLHWDWIDDTAMLDPNHPESLVYKVDRRSGTRTLEAAMFIMPKEYTFDNPPPITSPLVQFHEHDNLCFTGGPAPQVRGLTNAQGDCAAPLVKFNPNIQVHVWIRPNSCGPFAALLGVGAGQIKAGEQRACDHDHTSLTL